MATFVGIILVGSGLVTAGGGLAAFLQPRLFLRLVFGDESPTSTAMFFVRHWGILIIAIGALTVDSAYSTAIRVPVLIAAVIEKFAIGLLVLFGPLKRTGGMTTIALVDGLFAILYVIYLLGL